MLRALLTGALLVSSTVGDDATMAWACQTTFVRDGATRTLSIGLRTTDPVYLAPSGKLLLAKTELRVPGRAAVTIDFVALPLGAKPLDLDRASPFSYLDEQATTRTSPSRTWPPRSRPST